MSECGSCRGGKDGEGGTVGLGQWRGKNGGGERKVKEKQ
jgi:hypothetical protein